MKGKRARMIIDDAISAPTLIAVRCRMCSQSKRSMYFLHIPAGYDTIHDTRGVRGDGTISP